MKRNRLVLLVFLGTSFILMVLQAKSYYQVNIGNRRNIKEIRPSTKYFGNNSTPIPTTVIVVTYMRSGSSLTGDILQQSPGAFYIYEPLRELEKLANQPGSNLMFVNGTVRAWPFDYTEEAVTVLRNWLNCETTKLHTPGISSSFLKFGIKTKQFRGCTTNHSLTVCASKLQKNCESSPVRILKVIRISLTAVRRLLYELPGLKIIHLIRDPRATLTSQARFGMCKISKGGKYGCTNTFCSKLENNELEEESIARMHLGRIKKVFYEDIALNPVDTSKTLFDFIGTTFTKEMEEYIVNITMAGNPDNCNICTTRSNSKLHIDEWRTKIKPSFRSIIEKRCNYVLQRYKYMQTANS